jgi:anthranilate synthase/aminodeoxychorismate synthase-like glutamine amidotransferase
VLLVLDNHDSFTFNLVQLLGRLGAQVKVLRSGETDLAALKRLKPKQLLISPGPGRPEAATLSLQALEYFAGRIPVLGVCLGHQALAVAFGAKVTRAKRLMHGKASLIQHDGQGLFKGLPQRFSAIRYHSLLVDPDSLGPDFTPSAWTPQGELMGLRHRSGALGVQFHPESILTECGDSLLRNFLSLR